MPGCVWSTPPASAGPDGFRAELWVIADRSQDIKMSQGVQQDLAQVGVRLELKNVAFAEWSEATGRRRNVACCFTGCFTGGGGGFGAAGVFARDARAAPAARGAGFATRSTRAFVRCTSKPSLRSVSMSGSKSVSPEMT